MMSERIVHIIGHIFGSLRMGSFQLSSWCWEILRDSSDRLSHCDWTYLPTSIGPDTLPKLHNPDGQGLGVRPPTLLGRHWGSLMEPGRERL